jgi:4'-phosphopantetheinyl transferase
MVAAVAQIHVWRARLDAERWPSAERLPRPERARAARIQRPQARRRWVASRWALRGVLGRYLRRDPAAIELETGVRGKPALPDPAGSLRFNLSHSRDLAVVAVARGREVGVDVEWIDPRGDRPAGFYASWTRREAVAKCAGAGLWAPVSESGIAISGFDAAPGFAAAIAVTGADVPPLRRFALGSDLVPTAG